MGHILIDNPLEKQYFLAEIGVLARLGGAACRKTGDFAVAIPRPGY
jgi:hypothetical protein